MRNLAILLLFCAALYSYSAHALPASSEESEAPLSIQPRFGWGGFPGPNFWCQGRCHWQCWWSGYWTGWCDSTANSQCNCEGPRYPSATTSAPPSSGSTSAPTASSTP